MHHTILVALFALLQGMAPLLHAHLGADRSGASGVHMHAGLHAAVPASPTERFTDAGPLETQVVGLGQEIRRDPSWQPNDVAQAAPPAWGEASSAAQEAPGIAAGARPARTGHRLVPPSRAPPRATTTT
jgi:hypothetical protein